jgi:hypothetical protein
VDALCQHLRRLFHELLLRRRIPRHPQKSLGRGSKSRP